MLHWPLQEPLSWAASLEVSFGSLLSVCSPVTLISWGFDFCLSRFLGAPRMPLLNAYPSSTWRAFCCACPVEWQGFVAPHGPNAAQCDGVSGPTKVELCGHHVWVPFRSWEGWI